MGDAIADSGRPVSVLLAPEGPTSMALGRSSGMHLVTSDLTACSTDRPDSGPGRASFEAAPEHLVGQKKTKARHHRVARRRHHPGGS